MKELSISFESRMTNGVFWREPRLYLPRHVLAILHTRRYPGLICDSEFRASTDWSTGERQLC